MAASNGPQGAHGARSRTTTRNPPHLPTPLEAIILLLYPALLIFGSLFSLLSPETRGSAYNTVTQSHVQSEAPSYFARKDNLFNVLFVKRGWAWITIAFVVFLTTHPALASSSARRIKAGLRWGLITGWWILVTQWCFGPAIIDRGFRFTGGRCEVAREAVFDGSADTADFFTAAACKSSGGRWSGGHDISGHVFLLVLGSWFLIQEVGWVFVRAGGLGHQDERSIVMGDGAVKGAGVEAEPVQGEQKSGLGVGGKFAVAIIALCCWMLLMTAIYFHTWFEKLTGLLTALMGIYPVYYLPRWIPALRGIVGLPGL
ncbi:inositol phospholipid synthesis and fat-storage-inducing TM-domain-containing protein [Xylariales sp. PMI_506]|nr:inositol phospholipid synthesis and fat-storage-inducing TM-domain-containing protein [Xylariales sp. PMI_506]